MWPTTCNNNRPVSLFTAVSTICERVASTQLASYLKNKKRLTEQQSRSKKSHLAEILNVRKSYHQSPPKRIMECKSLVSDDTLSYDEHIMNTVSARIARLILINRVNYILDTQTLLNIIKALVCSKLYYNCSSVWGGGGFPYKKGGDARREISNEPLKGTNLGVA